jgi:dihydroorotate dehydrogenase (NAD+) catalytic subunit
MLNSIGIPSAGAERFIAEDLPRLRAAGPPVIVSIAEESVDSFRRLARMIEATGMRTCSSSTSLAPMCIRALNGPGIR